jgi:hypothetical protein
MSLHVLQRHDWHGPRHESESCSSCRKPAARARAVLVTHQLGWEVRLAIGAQLEAVQTQVCRTQEEVLSTGEEWKGAMVEKGWR